MCLAIPVRIESIENGVADCRVGEGDTFIKASLMLTEGEAKVGDYLIVHAGFALRILDPKEVARAVLWMASDDSGMMTGAVIPFDQSVHGGYEDAPVPAAKLEA